MASNRLAHRLFYMANWMPVVKRQAAATAVKCSDVATGSKAAECAVRSGYQQQPYNKGRTMASAAQELAHEESGSELHQERGGRRGALSRGGRYSPWGAFDLLDSFFPNRNLRAMIDTMDRVFDDPFSRYSRLRPGGAGGSRASLISRPPWDFVETDDAFRMRLDVPGLSKEEVKVFVEDGNLVIKGEHNEENKADEAQWASRSSGTQYSTRILLPENANPEQIKAELKNGVLSVTVPKILETETKKSVIDVQIE